MKKLKLAAWCVGLVASCAAIPASIAAESKFPTHPVRMLVPYAPGGATDNTARLLANKLSEMWGQQVIVDNRAGGSGIIALELASNAAPDGYTLMVGNVSTNAINETAFAKQMHFKPSQTLTGVTNLIELPHFFLVSGAVPVSNLKELIALAKKQKMSYASAGIASYPHLDVARLLKAAGIEMTHVPYKGGAGQMIPALISNETQFAVHHRSLQVGTSEAADHILAHPPSGIPRRADHDRSRFPRHRHERVERVVCTGQATQAAAQPHLFGRGEGDGSAGPEGRARQAVHVRGAQQVACGVPEVRRG
jgi:tripartite-type tricarboxylate transporter receptor subunit TctC